MSSDEGTPEDFAAMAAALRGPDSSEAESAGGAEDSSTSAENTGPTPDRAEIGRRHRIPNLADQLVGETAAELEADAAAKAALLQVFTPSPWKTAANEAIVRAIHGTDEAEGNE
jgi:hypothetical protein